MGTAEKQLAHYGKAPEQMQVTILLLFHRLGTVRDRLTKKEHDVMP